MSDEFSKRPGSTSSETDPGAGGHAKGKVLPLPDTHMADALDAVRDGHVDALFVPDGPTGWMFTLGDADRAYRLLIEDMSEGALTLTPDGTIAYANRRFADLSGRPLNQVIGSKIGDCFAPEARDRVATLVAAGQQTKHSAELDLLTHAGVRVPTFLSVSPLLTNGLPSAVCLVVTDLTSQRRSDAAIAARATLLAMIESQRVTEARLRESLALLRLHDSALTANPQGVMITDAQHRITYVNPAFEAIFGYDAGEIAGQLDSVLLSPDTDAILAGEMQRALAAGLPFHGELLRCRKDKSSFWSEVSATPVLDDHGVASQFVAVHRDISVRRERDAQLRLLETCVANLNDIVMITEAEPLDEPGPRIVFVNEAFTRRTGYSREEVIGRTPRMLQGPKTDRQMLAVVSTALRRWEPVCVEIINYAKDGTEFWIEMQIVPVANAAGGYTHLVAIERDISARKSAEAIRSALENQVRESHKMEAVGMLASSIAHDFNNIMGAILGNVSLARQDLPADHPAALSVAQIQVAGLRARSLVQKILSFTQRQVPQMQAQPLRALVEEGIALLRATLPSGVTINRVLSAEPLGAVVDATQLNQLLMNLGINAWHALQGKPGQIEVGLEALRFDAATPPPRPGLRLGLAAHLWVRDSGCGMTPEVMQHIFEPFFTTKMSGQGTGLGLAAVASVVKAHAGVLDVESTPDAGSCFHIYLPALDAAALAATQEPVDPDTVPAALAVQGQRVIYIDDDDVMRLLVERLLRRAGFHASGFAVAAEALDALRAAPLDCDLVITDYNMPQMSGLDVARAVAALRADLPVILTTGSLTDDLIASALEAGVTALVNKERTFEDLAPLALQVLARAAR